LEGVAVAGVAGNGVSGNGGVAAWIEGLRRGSGVAGWGVSVAPPIFFEILRASLNVTPGLVFQGAERFSITTGTEKWVFVQGDY